MAVCAKAQNKPFYVVAESFKFVRLFPLNQQDVPDKFKYKADTLKSVQTGQDLREEHPWVDYTSPFLNHAAVYRPGGADALGHQRRTHQALPVITGSFPAGGRWIWGVVSWPLSEPGQN